MILDITPMYVQRRFYDSCDSHIPSRAHMLLEMLSVRSGWSTLAMIFS